MTYKGTYKGVAISYNEHNDKWEFTLRGQERSASTLSKAKAVIDKPAPKNKKPFQRFKAWTKRGWGEGGFIECEVTSIADAPSWSTPEVWVQKGSERRKVYARDVYLKNARNDSLIAEIGKLEKQFNEVRTLIDERQSKLESIQIKREDD